MVDKSTQPASKLLINEPPLQVLPTLAVRLGLNEAIFVQQLHWLLNQSKIGKEIGGRKWVFNTMEEWREIFPFWSINTIRAIIAKLVEADVILEGNYNEKLSRTKWYTIDYNALEEKTIREPRKKRDDYPNFGDTMKEKRRTSKVRTLDDPKFGDTIVQSLDVILKTSSETSSYTLSGHVANAPVQADKFPELEAPMNSKPLQAVEEAKAVAKLSAPKSFLNASQEEPKPAGPEQKAEEPPTSSRPPLTDDAQNSVKQAASLHATSTPRKVQPVDALKDAVAVVLGATDRASMNAKMGRVVPIVFGDKKNGRCDGLIAYECARQGKDKSTLDYSALAEDVPLFWKWFKAEFPDVTALIDCAKWLDHWSTWRGIQTTKAADTVKYIPVPIDLSFTPRQEGI